MPSTHNFTIVVGVDFSEPSDHALDEAFEIANLHDGSEVHVLYVEPDHWIGGIAESAWIGAKAQDEWHVTASVDKAVAKVQELARQRLALTPQQKQRLRRVVAHVRHGSAAHGIVQLAAHLDADLVVVGSHGHRGIERFFLGSVAERVSRLARCPVWIVRPKDHSISGRVPEIEPPCPDCITKRQESQGATLWCARHSEHHYLPPHTHHYTNDGFFSAETTAYESFPERRM